MSRSLSVATYLEKAKLASSVPFLLLLDITVIDPADGSSVEHLYLVNNNEDFVFGGNTYVAFSFDISLREESGAQAEIQLSVKDFKGLIEQRLQDYGGGIGFPVKLMIVNAAQADQPAEIVEFFEVVGASAANYSVSFTLGAESALAKPFPRRRQMRDFCSWRYKSANCKYVGGLTSCDLTLDGTNGCSAHSNVINFGGFPGITGGARYG